MIRAKIDPEYYEDFHHVEEDQGEVNQEENQEENDEENDMSTGPDNDENNNQLENGNQELQSFTEDH